MIIFHHGDLDGRCAAAIAARGLGGPFRFVECDYRRKIDLSVVGEAEVVVVVDFSDEALFERCVGKKACVLWIDHHKTAVRFERYGFGGVRDYTGRKSASLLAWEFFFGRMEVPRALALVDAWDTWKHVPGDWSKEFAAGMSAWDDSPGSDVWEYLLFSPVHCRGRMVGEVVQAGRSIMISRARHYEELCEAFGFEAMIDGVKAFVLNAARCSSLAFGKRVKEYPVCAAYMFDGQRFEVSLYSEVEDVSVIAKAHGGGGHKGAAGFTCGSFPFTPAGSPTVKR